MWGLTAVAAVKPELLTLFWLAHTLFTDLLKERPSHSFTAQSHKLYSMKNGQKLLTPTDISRQRCKSNPQFPDLWAVISSPCFNVVHQAFKCFSPIFKDMKHYSEPEYYYFANTRDLDANLIK